MARPGSGTATVTVDIARRQKPSRNTDRKYNLVNSQKQITSEQNVVGEEEPQRLEMTD